MIREHRFASRDEAATALADAVAGQLAARLARPGAATLVVSGGTTPRPFFAALSDRDLDWERVRVTVADERWVAADHPASNEGLVRRELLAGRAAAATFVGLSPDGAPSPAEAAEDAARRLAGWTPFDVVVLGMGDDGHTASLFPAARGLAAALDRRSKRLCVAIDPPGTRHLRLTLTAAALVNAGHVALHLHGEEKQRVLAAAREPGPVEAMPVRAVLRWAASGVDVYWAP